MNYYRYTLSRHPKALSLAKCFQVQKVIGYSTKKELLDSVRGDDKERLVVYNWMRFQPTISGNKYTEQNYREWYLEILQRFFKNRKLISKKKLEADYQKLYEDIEKKINELKTDDVNFNENLYNILTNFLVLLSYDCNKKYSSLCDIDMNFVARKIWMIYGCEGKYRELAKAVNITSGTETMAISLVINSVSNGISSIIEDAVLQNYTYRRKKIGKSTETVFALLYYLKTIMQVQVIYQLLICTYTRFEEEMNIYGW